MILKFPEDMINFGKYSGKSIEYIVSNDRQYFNWLITNKNITLSSLMNKYLKGEQVLFDIVFDIVNQKIKSNDILVIERRVFYKYKQWYKLLSKIEYERIEIDLPYTIVSYEKIREGCDPKAILLEDKFYTYTETLYKKEYINNRDKIDFINKIKAKYI